MRVGAAAASALFLLLGALCGLAGFGPFRVAEAGAAGAAHAFAPPAAHAGHDAGAPGETAAAAPCGGRPGGHAPAAADAAAPPPPPDDGGACHQHCQLYDQALKAELPPMAPTAALALRADHERDAPGRAAERRVVCADPPVPRFLPILHASLLL